MTSTQRRAVAAAGLVLVAAAGGAWAWRAWAAHARARASPTGTVAAGGAVAGAQRSWALALDTEMAPSEQARPIRVRLTGRWVTTIAAARAHELDVACEIDGANVSGVAGGDRAPAQSEALKQRLSR
ncbi:MAG: hypothetical protein LC659_08255, partial [Myxococcales bacterium]|nr:hypothetical protein [Myxococcales bacterium]